MSGVDVSEIPALYWILQTVVVAGIVAVGGLGVAVLSRIGMVQDERAGRPAGRGHTRWYFGGLAAMFLVAPVVFIASTFWRF